MLWVLIALSVTFAFINGLRDSSSIVTGVISSQSMRPRTALTLCGLAEVAAPFIFGVAVARTVTTGLVRSEFVSLGSITAAVAAALAWTVVSWKQGIPSSSSHALVGGLLGAALTIGGPHSVIASGLLKVVLPLFLAPLIGLGAGYVSMRLILFAVRNATPRVNLLFQRLQIATMLGLALSHSANDAQKSMGVIALGLLLSGRSASFEVPLAVVAACALAIGLGASRGDLLFIVTVWR